MKLYLVLFFLLEAAAVEGADSSDAIESDSGVEILSRIRRHPACNGTRALLALALADPTKLRQQNRLQKEVDICERKLDRKCAKWETLLSGSALNRARRGKLERKLLRKCENATLPYVLRPDESCIFYSSTSYLFDYTGTKSVTRSGKPCMNWLLDDPHSHNYHFLGDHSYCRNPNDVYKGPWCYTTDVGELWDFCFDACNAGDCVKPDETCAYQDTPVCWAKEYTGTKSVTRTGAACDNWTIFWGSKYNNSNLCRNPTASQGPWCWMVTGGWEYCFDDCSSNGGET